jgi:PE family
MTFLSAQTDLMSQAVGDLANLRHSVDEAASAAVGQTTAIAPAAGDEISEMVSQVFADFGKQYHGALAQASQFHDGFATVMKAGTNAYTAAETASAAMMSSAADMGQMPSQVVGAVEGLIGSNIETNGAALANFGIAFRNSGGFLSEIGKSEIMSAQENLQVLQTGDAAVNTLPEQGIRLGAVLGQFPDGVVEEAVGSAGQFVGNGLVQAGMDLLKAGQGLENAADAVG